MKLMAFQNALKTKRAGFTLIELLVVIAIIAILSTVGLSAFTSAQQRGRDAKRQGDVSDLKNAMEQAYTASATSIYPSCSAAAATYMQGGILPSDPKGVAYTCAPNATGSTFCICTALESKGKGNATALGACGSGGLPTFGTVAPTASGFFCVVNSQ